MLRLKILKKSLLVFNTFYFIYKLLKKLIFGNELKNGSVQITCCIQFFNQLIKISDIFIPILEFCIQHVFFIILDLFYMIKYFYLKNVILQSIVSPNIIFAIGFRNLV